MTGGISGTDYSYTNGVLTVNSGANITISMASGATAMTSDRIVVNGNAKITLNGVNITPVDAGTDDGYSGIDLASGATLNITLQSGSSNVINGGTSITGAPGPGIHVPESSTLIIGGNGSLEVKGASHDSEAAVGIGGNASASQAGEACGNVLILGGTIKVHCGTPKYSIGKQPVDIGGGTSDMQKGGDCNTVIILTPVNSGGGLTIGGGAGSSIGGGNASNGQGIRPSSDGSYTVWGELTLPSGIEFPSDITLNIPSGTTLNLPTDFTWPENITVTGDGKITPDNKKLPAKITFKENLSKTATGNRIELVEGEDYTYNGNGEVSIKWFTDIDGEKQTSVLADDQYAVTGFDDKTVARVKLTFAPVGEAYTEDGANEFTQADGKNTAYIIIQTDSISSWTVEPADTADEYVIGASATGAVPTTADVVVTVNYASGAVEELSTGYTVATSWKTGVTDGKFAGTSGTIDVTYNGETKVATFAFVQNTVESFTINASAQVVPGTNLQASQLNVNATWKDAANEPVKDSDLRVTISENGYFAVGETQHIYKVTLTDYPSAPAQYVTVTASATPDDGDGEQ